MEKLVKHFEEPPQSLRRARPEIPPPFEAIILRLMAKDPAERYQSPLALLDDLDPLCKPEVRGPLSGDTMIGPDSRTASGTDEEVGSGWKLPVAGAQASEPPKEPPAATTSDPSHEALAFSAGDRWKYLGVGVALGMVVTLAVVALARFLT
jgi:serine/threonine protein kinase